MMDSEQRDAIRASNQRRAIACRKCGSLNTEDCDGSTLDQSSHFAGVIYRVCHACGDESVKKVGKVRR